MTTNPQSVYLLNLMEDGIDVKISLVKFKSHQIIKRKAAGDVVNYVSSVAVIV